MTIHNPTTEVTTMSDCAHCRQPVGANYMTKEFAVHANVRTPQGEAIEVGICPLCVRHAGKPRFNARIAKNVSKKPNDYRLGQATPEIAVTLREVRR